MVGKDRKLDKDELDDSVVAEEYQGDEVKKLKDKVKLLEAKAKEYLDSWQRAQADFANLRRRDEESKLEFVKFAKLSIIEELIPVLDSFNIAMSHSAKSEQTGGIEPIFDQLMKVLKSSGLEEIDPLGNTFDPHEHEAISMSSTDKKSEDHKVTKVMQKGFKLNDKVIRPAKVTVGEYKKD